MTEQQVRVHQIKIDFHVTEQIKRYVYVYVLEAEHCYLVDSGVYGCEDQILAYLQTLGRTLADVKGIFLTHAHPDHIGSAAWFQEHTACKIYASEGERRWIEDIDLQFKERPIPNFYKLAGRSSRVDVVVKDGDVIALEEDLQLQAISTAGHSSDGMSYLVGAALFIGDAVPVKGDIPIWVDEQKTRNTLEKLSQIPGVATYYPAWDHTYTQEEMPEVIGQARGLVELLKAAVTAIDDGRPLPELVDAVCAHLKLPMLKANPLFARTLASLREA